MHYHPDVRTILWGHTQTSQGKVDTHLRNAGCQAQGFLQVKCTVGTVQAIHLEEHFSYYRGFAIPRSLVNVVAERPDPGQDGGSTGLLCVVLHSQA
jgi:hypothetical protein